MMPVAKQIEPQPWMIDPDTAAVMKVLAGDNDGPQTLFVGGCVRNALLNRPVDDIDVATRLRPEAVITRLEQAGIKAIPTGIDHGTVTAISGEHSIEITTLRRDVETDGRHAVIAYTEDWRLDAARRDFTVNTLLADDTGNIYDPTGQGLTDLAAGRIVFVGEPEERIAEDYLRILRFYRFHAYYGSGSPDARAVKACRAAADKITTLSRERITQEFLKILMAEDAPRILAQMFENKVMADLPKPGYEQAVMQRLCRLQRDNDMARLITRLAVLVTAPEDAEAWLILSNRQKDTLALILKAASEAEQTSEAEVKIMIYRYGNEVAGQALLLDAARRNNQPNLELVKSWQAPSLPVGGDDVLAAGIPAGPAIGRLLKQTEQWWMDRNFSPDREQCLAYIQSLKKDLPA